MFRAILLGSALAAAFIAGVLLAPPTADKVLNRAAGVVLFEGMPVPDLSFQNQQGAPVDLSSLRGKWVVMFFGYTFCPDVCPMTLMHLSKTWKQLTPDEQSALQVVMVSVDPERDTPDSLGPYLNYFNPAFIALTGNQQSLSELALAVNAFYARVERGEGQAYLMDHSANIVLLDPAGNYRGYIEPPHQPTRLAPVLQALLSHASAD
jgi:protein SCO1/2